MIPDPLFNSRYLHELYTRADPNYSGRATVPVLWDKHTQTIVNNEFLRDHPHVQHRVRRGGRKAGRFLSEGPAERDRRGE